MSIQQRKIDHIHHVLTDPQVDRQGRYFDAFRLLHNAMPEMALSDVDLRCQFLGKPLQAPLIIASMTGGMGDELAQINRRLAEAAEACGVALAVGSQRIQFEQQAAESSFALRAFAPSIPLIANIGAVQLNYQLDARHAQQAIDTLNADGLYLHLNPLQEAIQPEGDTNFRQLWQQITTLKTQINRPILLKEVGSGLSPQLVKRGLQHGIEYFDVAGSGGTSWSRIEQLRSDKHTLGLTFQDWGLPTPWILQQLRPQAAQAQLIASGGLRNGVDMVKSIVLGARMTSMAAPFLQPAMESTQAVIDRIEQLKQEMRIALFLLGKPTLEDCWLADHLVVNLAEGRQQ